MKSIEKVKRQRRIKNIPPYCDNPLSDRDVKLQQAIAEGRVSVSENRRMSRSYLHKKSSTKVAKKTRNYGRRG